MDKLSDLNHLSISSVEDLYNQFLADPSSVDESWQHFFKGFELALQNSNSIKFQKSSALPFSEEFKVISLINAYRERGHYFTQTNPVRTRRKYQPTLDIENFSIDPSMLDHDFEAGNEIGVGKAKLRHIIDVLEKTYCRSVGVEYMYIRNTQIVAWLKEKMEGTRNEKIFSKEDKTDLLKLLAQAVNFEKFIHTKFPGQKSFSLEGAESLIPALKALIVKATEFNYKEFVMGMPHRGRLNVLANILHKSYDEIFSEFEGKPFEGDSVLGDVKYHMGYSSDYTGKNGNKVKLTLSPNPSHLEAVGPVVEGIVRAKNDKSMAADEHKSIPILIHGDASIAGQGVVYEVVQMSELPGYSTGGTIHLVVNNQLGFTTNYLDGRSSTYCTDVAKIIQSPIFHVNADDIEAVVYTVLLAMEYREKFHKDVFIDLLGYRKYGHNESDEPRYTQPMLYKIIEKHLNPLQLYSQKLLQEGVITQQEIKNYESLFFESLESDLASAKMKTNAVITPFLQDTWKNIVKGNAKNIAAKTGTSVAEETLRTIAEKLVQVPPDKPFFKKILKLQNDRKALIDEGSKLDWAMCELLAYGSLLYEGIPVRLSGQDVKRGTFSHRHAVLTIEDSEEEFIPLNHISENQATFSIYNSLLSEYGVLGFEYGYALASPQALTIWEAQFGDFFNGAQIIIDQFVVSAEEKWNVFNGLVMYLPHGFEGQGPEHSSGRMERFLTLCGDNNIQVANCTTPASFFHLLRRQVKRPVRKPLVIFTPKSLLRHPRCTSSVEELTRGGFQEVIDDTVSQREQITTLLFCTGKIYYDLLETRIKKGISHAALIRVEQLYPFPKKKIEEIISKYPEAERIYWVQEEPANMGAAPFIKVKMQDAGWLFITRRESGSPATGSSQTHKRTQQKLIDKALGECQCERKLQECNMYCSKEI
jgi:2-oxoglutarate dehydrogenase E1 component